MFRVCPSFRELAFCAAQLARTYLVREITHLFTGKAFNLDYKEEQRELAQTNPKGLSIDRNGWLTDIRGRVPKIIGNRLPRIFWGLPNRVHYIPRSAKAIQHIMKQNENQESSHLVYSILNFISDSTKTVLALSGPEGIRYHNDIASSFNKTHTDKYIQSIIGFIQEKIDAKVELNPEILTNCVRRAVAIHLLGFDSLTEADDKLLDQQLKFMKTHSNIGFLGILGLFRTARKERSCHKEFAQQLLSNNVKNIQLMLQRYAVDSKEKNATVIHFLHAIKNKHPEFDKDELKQYLKYISEDEVRSYFEEDWVKALPALLFAVDNLGILLHLALDNLGIEDFREPIRDNLCLYNMNGLNAHLNIDRFRRSPVLDAYLKEILRCYNFIDEQPRFIESEIAIDDISIPGNSLLTFDIRSTMKHADFGGEDKAIWLQRYKQGPASEMKIDTFPFVRFGLGPRRCPASTLSQDIAFAVIIYFITRYDFTSGSKPFHFLMTPRTTQVENILIPSR